jgi:tetratricopeptide (TPR) repeat protein
MARLRSVRSQVCVAIFVMVMGGSALAGWDWWTVLPDDAPLRYVGRQSCVSCHQAEANLWTGSHHDLAMDEATPATVLGDFRNATLTHHGVTSRMFQREDGYFVHTEGPDGKMADFRVKYVLGVAPLQQYMVEFDRSSDQPANELARLQVLRISWDTAGQRWFHLDPPDVREKLAPDDDLHWTGILQRWNNMCADCHSTNLQRRFDPRDGRYRTTFSEIDVSCEACHGPGNLHVELATAKSLFWDRKRGYGLAKLKGESNRPEIETCAPCHSRRSIVSPHHRPGEPYYDGFHNERLGDLTYHADGQILDEVYEYGSFTQSKMYHKGIKCSDCHDPHSLRLRHPDNKLCTSCHAHPAGKYDGPGHHHHQPGSAGAQCVNCHMPATTYMAVDPRRDHSLRIPRPSLSVDLGTPNACTGCHLEVDRGRSTIDKAKRDTLGEYADWLKARDADPEVRVELERLDRWSLAAARRWWGEKPDDAKHHAHAFHAARSGRPDAERRLTEVANNRTAPSIVRATALDYLARFSSDESLAVAERLLESTDPQIQLGALERCEAQIGLLDAQLDPAAGPERLAPAYRELARRLAATLDAPARAVRHAAARVLVRVPMPVRGEVLATRQRERLDAVIDELIASQAANADRAGSHMLIALVEENRGRFAEAIEAYETAIRVEPHAAGARGNLAALYDRLAEIAAARREAAELRGDKDRAAQVAAEGARCREEAKRLRSEELTFLERDARLAPQLLEPQYRYAMSLYVNQREADSERVLRAAVDAHPKATQPLLALALLLQKQGRAAEALRFAEMLLDLQPSDEGARYLRDTLAEEAAAGPRPAPAIP